MPEREMSACFLPGAVGTYNGDGKEERGGMLELNKTYNLHVHDGLSQLDAESIDCIITSPPYWKMRDYDIEPQIWGGDSDCKHKWGPEVKSVGMTGGTNAESSGATWIKPHYRHMPVTTSSWCQKCGAWKGSLGSEPTLQLYMKNLYGIFTGIKRVLKKTGTVWVDFGDKYANNTVPGNGDPTIGIRKLGDKADIKYPKGYLSGVPQKSLYLIPDRFRIMMVDGLGFACRNKIIWWKRNCLVSSAKDRFTIDFEEISFFSKSRYYNFEQQFEGLVDSTHNDRRIKESCFSRERRQRGYQGAPSQGSGMIQPTKPGYRNKRCVWDIATRSSSDTSHTATFPEELIETPILAGCPIGGIVLDPFMGTGTVGKKALKLDRNFIGFELNPEWAKKSNDITDKMLQQTRIDLPC